MCGTDIQPPWPKRTPGFYDEAATVFESVRGASFRGSFVSARADVPDGKDGEFRLRRRFVLKAVPSEGWLQGIGDASATFSVNGKKVATSGYSFRSGRNDSFLRDVRKELRAGDNVLEVTYRRIGLFEYDNPRTFPGGALLELFVRNPDGSFLRIDSDAQFESSADGTNWTDVVLSPPPPAAPRCARLRYRDFEHPQILVSGGTVTSSVTGGGKVDLDCVFRGRAPEGPFDVRVALCRGRPCLWTEEVQLGPENVECLGADCWRLRFAYSTPVFVSAGPCDVSIGSNSICCPDDWTPVGRFELLPPKPEGRDARPPVVEMKPVAGNPEIHIDGRPVPMLWGAVEQHRRPDHLPVHGEMPLSAVTVYNHYDEWHPRFGEYDFRFFDRAAEEYRRANPDAWFMWDLTVYPPPDFATRHPEEMAADETGDCEVVGRFSYSYASKVALAEMKEMVTEAIRYLEASPYANRIIGYRINSGVTTEWLGWDAKPRRSRDFSRPGVEAFRIFAAERYPQLADPHVPDLAERCDYDSGNDILWDQQKHLNAIAYNEYNSWIIQKDILEMCGCAKDVLRSLCRTKLVGTYYGYTFYVNRPGHNCRRGHFALEDLLARNGGRVDFLMSPQSYTQRTPGDTCGDMKPFATMEAHDVKPIIEDDTRTHGRIRPIWYGMWSTVDAEQTESILRRNAGIVVCRRSIPYFFSLSSGLEHCTPESARVGANALAAVSHSLAKKVGRHAEVALVASERSVCAMPDTAFLEKRTGLTGHDVQEYAFDGSVKRFPEDAPIFNGEIFSSAHTRFARAGAPVDFVLAEDLPTHAGDYRLYVFLNLLASDARIEEAVRRIRERGATCLWLYAPGYLKDNTVAAMRTLTGMRFVELKGPVRMQLTMADGRKMGMPSTDVARAFSPVGADEVLGTYATGEPGAAISRIGGGTSVFSGTWQLDLDFIREVYRRAGVRVWCETGDPMEANDGFFTLHARFAGEKTVKLPRRAGAVVDVFNHRVLARDTDTFAFDAPLHSTHLFYFGEDGDELLTRLRESRKGN